jgi:hypothetical protein
LQITGRIGPLFLNVFFNGISGQNLPMAALVEKLHFFSNKYLTSCLYLVRELGTLQGSNLNTGVDLWNWRKENFQAGKRMKRQ